VLAVHHLAASFRPRFTEGGSGSICTDCNPEFKGCQDNQPPRHVLFIVATTGIHQPDRRFRTRSFVP
jgi:hypothetical protein